MIDIGTPGTQITNDPLSEFRDRTGLAPEAFALAQQMLAPYLNMMGGIGGGEGFTQAAGRLDMLGGAGQLGMQPGEITAALNAIQRQSQQRKGQMAANMAGAGGMDPNAYYRASRGLEADTQGAIGNVYTQSAAMGRENLMKAVQALAPYFRTQTGAQESMAGEVAGLAGQAISSAPLTYGGQQMFQNWPADYGTPPGGTSYKPGGGGMALGMT